MLLSSPLSFPLTSPVEKNKDMSPAIKELSAMEEGHDEVKEPTLNEQLNKSIIDCVKSETMD